MYRSWHLRSRVALRRRSVAGAILLTIGIGLQGCDGGADGSAAAAIDSAPPPVTVASPLVKTITEWYEFTGRFEAIESVEVRARVSGYVESVDFRDGQIVEQGQLLFVIDPRRYRAATEEASASGRARRRG